MEQLPNNITLDIPAGCFPLSTDSMVLAHFAAKHGARRILDLGSGCGTLGLLLCADNARCRVMGVELDETAHAAALENIARNHLCNRMNSICADLRSIPEFLPAGAFDCCVSNPPYFSGGPASEKTPLARREDCCTLENLLDAAARALKFGGDFYLVHKPDQLGRILALAGMRQLEAKRLGLLRHQAGAPVNLVLVQLRKGAKPGLKWEEMVLRNTDGSPTELYKEIYHLN